MTELQYKRERTEFGEDAHRLARELTEAINAYINEEKGDELKESFDVVMLISGMLMSGGNKQDNINRMIDSIMLFSINIGKAALEKDEPEA